MCDCSLQDEDELTQLIDQAAYISVTASTEAERMIAARKRLEAYTAIAQVEDSLQRHKRLLAYFPAPAAILELERT